MEKTGSLDVSSEVKSFVGDMERGNPEFSLSARVKAAWDRVVDDDTASHVVSVFVVPHTEGREVVVYVDSSLHAADLAMQTEMLRLKVNLELAKSRSIPSEEGEVLQVERLKFCVSKEGYGTRKGRKTISDDLSKTRERELSVEPVELDEEEFAPVMETISHVEDEKLRDVIYSASKANLEWQKGLRAEGVR